MHAILSFIKYLLTTNTVNFLIMLGILYWIVKKISIGTSLENAVKKIEDTIKNSESTKQEAQKLMDNEKALIDKLPSDLKDLELNTQDKIKVFEATIEKDTQKAIRNLEKGIDRVISVEEDKISNLIKDNTAITSVEVAKEHLEKLLYNNMDLHNKFIDSSLEELDKVEL